MGVVAEAQFGAVGWMRPWKRLGGFLAQSRWQITGWLEADGIAQAGPFHKGRVTSCGEVAPSKPQTGTMGYE